VFCLVCEGKLAEFINFGPMPIANNFSPVPLGKNQYTFEMRVGACEACGTVQLVEQPDRQQMFHENYAFFSSTSKAMDQHFQHLSDCLVSKFEKIDKELHTLEIGCNDGILLKYLDSKSNALGIEPSSNVAAIARSKGLNVQNTFFDEECVKQLQSDDKCFEVIVSANVICHAPYINTIFSGVEKILTQDGIFVHEDPYLVNILEQGTFDQIYDEHVFLFSCLSQQKIAKQNGLELHDVELIPTHGGSARYYFCKPGKYKVTDRLKNQIQLEYDSGINQIETLINFANAVEAKKRNFNQLIRKLKEDGNKIVGYGATSKSTTILNFFGLDSNSIDCIYDTTPTKIGKYTPCTDIPIKDYSTFKQENADFVILFAWNHREEIFQKETNFFKETGKKWLTILPKIEVVE